MLRGAVAVAPQASESTSTPPPTERHPTLERGARYLYGLWEWLQTSHCGQYSVERMLAYDEYRHRTSRARVACVLLLTPLPAILVVVLTECVPLRPAAEGALANFMFWNRHAAMVTLILLGAMKQAKEWIPGAPLTRQRIVGLSLGCAAVATWLDILVARLWVFPIPFLVVLGAPVLEAIVALAVICTIGRGELRAVQDGAVHLRRYVNLFSAQTSLMLIYPAYHALFLVSPGLVQRLLLLLLPALDLALKNLIVAFGSHLEDQLPEEVVFVVDVSDALYTTLCMRSVNSFLMVAIMAFMRLADATLSLHSMHKRFRFLRTRGQELGVATVTPLKPSLDNSTHSTRNLMQATLKLLLTPATLDSSELNRIRLQSGVRYKIADETAALLRSLGSHAGYQNDRASSKASSIAELKSRYASATMSGLANNGVNTPAPRIPQLGLFRLLRPAAVVVPAVDAEASPLSSTPRVKDVVEATPLCTFSSASESTAPTIADLSLRARRPADHSIAQSSPVVDNSFEMPALLPQGSPDFSGSAPPEALRRNTLFVNQTLQLLFNNEFLGLIAYTQCIVPVMYMVYMAALQQLPNRVFYPGTRNVEDAGLFANRMLVIGMLVGFHLSLLLVLHQVVASRFAVSTLHQIAFVLETQTLLVHGKLTAWLIFSVGFQLEHYGADFSFQFAWMRDRTMQH